MKRLSVLWFLLFCPAFLFAQENMVLDNAIMDSVNFFSSRLQKGTVVAVTNFEAETKELSNFIIQELMVAFSNTGNVRVVARSRLEMLEKELDFNMSGSVSDATAQRIGRMIGAQILFSGSISQYRDMYRMRIQAIVVETAEIIGTRTINIKYDSTLTGLLRKINPADAWKHQWLYAGFSAGYALQLNRPNGIFPVDMPLGFSIYARVQPFDLFGVALDISGDLFDGPNIFIVPTLTIRPSFFEIDLFLGIGLNMLYGGAIKIPDVYTNVAIAFTGGVRGGCKLGPGVLYAEVRPTGIIVTGDYLYYPYYPWEDYLYIPFNLNFTLGYQVGFFPRKK